MLHGIEIPEKVVPSLSRKANMRTTNSIGIPAECSLGTARSGRLSAFSQMLRNLKNACKVSIRMLFSPHPLSAFTKKEKIEPLRPKADGYVEDGQGPRSKQTVRFLNPQGTLLTVGLAYQLPLINSGVFIKKTLSTERAYQQELSIDGAYYEHLVDSR
jgi:hypothetical protein